jgi:hypothetical protein
VSISLAHVNCTLPVDEFGKVENFASEAVNEQLHRGMQIEKAPKLWDAFSPNFSQ